jgi:hypothetical protein
LAQATPAPARPLSPFAWSSGRARAFIYHAKKGNTMELNNQTNAIGATTLIAASAAVVGAATVSTGVDFDVLTAVNAEPVEKTFTVSVLFNEDGDHAAGFEIVGKNSEQYRDIIRATSVVAIKRSQTKKQQIDGKTDAGAGQLFDLGEDRNLKIAKAVVVGLPGFVSRGQPLPVNDANLNALFAKFPSWVDKIIAALEVDANFLTI